jgi:hypothetical protein
MQHYREVLQIPQILQIPQSKYFIWTSTFPQQMQYGVSFGAQFPRRFCHAR